MEGNEHLEGQEPLEAVTPIILALNQKIEDSIGNMELSQEHIQTLVGEAGAMIKLYEPRMTEGSSEFDSALDTLMFTKENLEDLLKEGSTRVSEDFLKEEEDNVGELSPVGEEENVA